ncbi:MAG: hypothetical protein IK134_12880 [Oscillospiraceae bacterium]|nr:hypothetical protein [Oscillospiraceae bacterium]
MRTGNNQILRQIPDSEWHTELPKYFVVDGSPDMFDQMTAYASAGIRSVEVLTREEYEYLINQENERLQEEAKGLVFAESEVTETLRKQTAKRGVKLNIVPDEQYQTDILQGWLASLASEAQETDRTEPSGKTKVIDCQKDDRTLLEYVNQAVIGSGITYLTVNYFFFSDLDNPDAEPSSHFSYSGKASQFEKTMQQHAFIFQYRMNVEVQRVEFDPDKDLCYIEIWV